MKIDHTRILGGTGFMAGGGRWALAALLAAGVPPADVYGAETAASPPVRTALSLYDRGFGLVTEMRRVTLDKGENLVRFAPLPARIEPGSVNFVPLSGPGGLEVLEQRFHYDLDGLAGLLARYRGENITVVDGEGEHRGQLVAMDEANRGDGEVDDFTLVGADGTAATFANLRGLNRIEFPDAGARAYLEPTLLWRAEASQEGPQNLRLTYAARDMNWRAHYECILDEKGKTAYLGGRVQLHNGAGGRFEQAQVKLVVTEKGEVTPPVPGSDLPPERRYTGAQRYSYGGLNPINERLAASAGTLATYSLPRPVTLEAGETRFVQLFEARQVPVNRFYVYDGVRFDRFQRNRRNDWNYGTEFHSRVEVHLEFENEARNGLGLDLPPGHFRLYQQVENEGVDLVGEDLFAGAKTDEAANLLLGPARGVEGERERTGFSEVTPLHEYDESFEIRLTNLSEEEVEIRVVEHLYRWSDYEITRADTEYTDTAPQTIEFRPVLKPGGKRSIHYTVRYRW